MKKIIFTLTGLFFSGVVFAQTTFGVKAGPDFSSLSTKTSGTRVTSKGLIGLQAGVYASLPVAEALVLQPSLFYSGKGGKYNLGDGFMQTQRLDYLSLPLALLYKAEMPNGAGSWFLGAGPYAAYGLSGRIADDAPGTGKINPFKDYGSGAVLKRFDAGADVQAGYEMAGGFNIGLSADLGLMNIAANGSNQRSTRNTSFAIMVGYAWGRGY